MAKHRSANAAFDEKILKIVQAHQPLKFASVVLRVNQRRGPGKGVDTREVDRALQRLRKACYVAFDPKVGWTT